MTITYHLYIARFLFRPLGAAFRVRLLRSPLWIACSVCAPGNAKAVTVPSRDFHVKDEPRSGQYVTDKIDAIWKKAEQDRHISSYDIPGDGLQNSFDTFEKRWTHTKARYLDQHELTERNLMNRVLTCDYILKCNETEPFLKRLITGDEKWIAYDKNLQKRSWLKGNQTLQTIAKSRLTHNKLMLCVRWYGGLQGRYSL
ncbi:Mariner Mos1 transposase [Eumeta japonica]|uniref:Mariner Mos1 transposase n=1 Tax=Eumeta variegata TaxID=151549 RepID=A0A4C1VY61_EUMVA|nr:Mariner Mos1 transposase [Eumeta japonica]